MRSGMLPLLPAEGRSLSAEKGVWYTGKGTFPCFHHFSAFPTIIAACVLCFRDMFGGFFLAKRYLSVQGGHVKESPEWEFVEIDPAWAGFEKP